MKHLVFRLHDTNEARCGDTVVVSKIKASPIPYLARKLIDEGHEPNTLVTVMRNQTICFKDSQTLGGWAEQQIIENDEYGIKRKRFVHFVGIDGGDA